MRLKECVLDSRQPAELRQSVVDALRTVMVVWSSEIVLARLSSNVQFWQDLLVSALVLVAMSVLPVLALNLFKSRPRAQFVFLALVGALAPAFVVAGIVGPTFEVLLRRRYLLPVLWLAIALAGNHCFLRARSAEILAQKTCALNRPRSPSDRGLGRGRDPFPHPWLLFGSLALATTVAWGFGDIWPPIAVYLAVIAAFGVLCASSVRPVVQPLIAILAALIALVPAPPARVGWARQGTPPEAPDVILLTIDTLRQDVGEEMETYQRLAREGVSFAHTQAAAPWTLPSMATIHTGLPIGQHGAGKTPDKKNTAIVANVERLADRFAEAGYDTAAVVAINPFLSHQFGFDSGFDIYDYADEFARYALPPPVRPDGPARPFAVTLLTRRSTLARRQLRTSRTIVSRGLRIYEDRRERPLFLWLHFMDCHLPYYDISRSDYGVPVDFDAPSKWWESAEGTKILKSAYRDETRLIDRDLLRFLDGLGPVPPNGRVIVFTADHGEEFFEHGTQGHGHALFQELTAVPLAIVGLPSRKAGYREDQLIVHHLDYAPTLLAVAGLSREGLPGLDLSKTSTAPIRIRITENMARAGPRDYSLRSGRWKVISV
ncbi:MAG: sulfatase, partial [Proteobacteria bacterium]|nr:sulfatase [Pseudomonadota bacterium]